MKYINSSCRYGIFDSTTFPLLGILHSLTVQARLAQVALRQRSSLARLAGAMKRPMGVPHSMLPITCEAGNQASIVLCTMNMVPGIMAMRVALDEDFRVGIKLETEVYLATEMEISSTTLLWRMRMVPWQILARTGIGSTHAAWRGRL